MNSSLQTKYEELRSQISTEDITNLLLLNLMPKECSATQEKRDQHFSSLLLLSQFGLISFLVDQEKTKRSKEQEKKEAESSIDDVTLVPEELDGE